MTLFTSDEKRVLRNIGGLAGASALCALTGAVYEIFSHEVYSFFMIYAFALPLGLGVLPLLFLLIKGLRLPGKNALWLWNAGIATLTAGSLMKGVLDIYGTTNNLVKIYPVLAVPMLLTAAVIWLEFEKPKGVTEKAK